MPWAAAATLGSTLLQGKFSRDSARKQMRFQEQMSNTAYQRAMEDMRKAGLNPILAGKLGGASTPSGALAHTPDFGGTTAKAMSTYNLKKLQDAQVQQQTATAKKLELENRILQLDYKMLVSRGLSPLQFRHTVLNQAGSEIYDNITSRIPEVKKEYLDPIIDNLAPTAKARSRWKKFFQGTLLRDLMKDTRFDKRARQILNRLFSGNRN